ncbi:arachidonate 5-lipoxygenase-like [Mizuhopecten yessoensis]|uniref:Arachidonate 5-lipoxygenase n=1 Tax=Mizuhopecten yessoensis TaxID=6573 RepID=A0A210Q6A1_MIZYE|nr:arachidonate 5-lipoxygenase-like [Mizuhopecten yessoensis]XP_021366197.1 arachidonate 5-lipoxygenase-like [Mizuhopecten yessoensis]XP_021366198.1 arachidonate 5-lipoxygenase-like [Mizuhopecten yessoensis]XP_021366199.1 arachidonate 5-lipoxygenase-like [Mizuhopecten yessoensis]OWF44209.1 Arachidonate 5-lipoxygenase [Mizuhopecten yessoensis]
MSANAVYDISVKTGDKKNAGTDANVEICLHCDDGNKTDTYNLDKFFRNDFERGQIDSFTVTGCRLNKVNYIELWRDTGGILDDWYVDVIEVVCSKQIFVFPFFRWIKPNYHYKVRHLDTSLPADDPFKEQREMELKDARKQYELTVKAPGLPPQVKNLPEDEQFSFDYMWDIGKRKAQAILTSKIIKLTSDNWRDLDDLKNVYTKEVFVIPDSVANWTEDEYFGNQRIAKINNCVIELCTAVPKKMGVTDDMVKQSLEGLTLASAIQAKRLFLVDYEILDGLPCGREDKVVCAPIALFFLNGKQKLMPIAIQLFQKPGKDNPVFLPTDPEYTWLTAKLWFNHADSSYHQSFTHLGGTHLKMEGVAVLTHRNLSPSHPVFKLLAPHFLYLLALNTRALANLVCPGGWADRAMSSGIKGMFEIIRRKNLQWRLDVDGSLPKDLERRGLLGDNVLPGYYFRDDALPVYNAIFNFVVKYVKLYYDTTAKLVGDTEIQDWAAETVLSKEKGGLGMRGVPGNGTITTIDQLATILTSHIYTCSVAHAASNFPQYDQYGFPPAYPASMRGEPPTDKKALTETAVLVALPDKATTLDMMVVTYILSERTTNCLGNFEVQYVYDPPAVAIIDEFKNELKVISRQIREKNKTRDPPYPWLDPEEIPNAISI